MIDISNYAYGRLKEAYDRLDELCDHPQSVLLAFTKKKANERVTLLKESAIDTNYLDQAAQQELLDFNYVQTIKNTSLLALTAKGVWEVEFRTKDSALEDLIDSIDSQFFSEFESLSITSKNKVVLMAMICMRSFSSKSAVDVKMEKNVYDDWWEIFVKVDEFLIEMGVIPSKDSISKPNQKKKSGIESNASDLIRHSDKVPRYTDNIFSKSGKNEYWLELIKNNTIDVERLAFLIKLTLGNKIDETNFETYSRFANDLCLDWGYIISPSYSETKFMSCDYDFMICDAFERASYLNMN